MLYKCLLANGCRAFRPSTDRPVELPCLLDCPAETSGRGHQRPDGVGRPSVLSSITYVTLHMYVCVYIYIYICSYHCIVSICVYVCICIYIYIHTCVFAHYYYYDYDDMMLRPISVLRLDFRGLYSGIILISRGGHPMSRGIFPESLSQPILAGTILVGGLGV